MILRRPYAFLIKHFKFIHIVLFALLLYVITRANNMLTFFKNYISANSNIEVISSNYFSYNIIISILFIIIFSLIVYLLMRYKKKPRTLYILIIIVSLLSLVSFIYLYRQIRVLEVSSISAREIRLLRDISRFNFWGLLVITIPVAIRALGFDIKKFNFSKDIADLKLEKEDNEEVEVNVELNSESIKRGGRKLKRELKYYYVENKFFINIILGVVLLILVLIYPFNRYVINRNLNENEILKTDYFNIKIKNSYISERKSVSKNNSYLILKVDLKANINNYILSLDNLVLEGKNNTYIPSLKYYNYFRDLGIGYYQEKIDTTNYKEYLLIYNINNEDKDNKLTLKYLENNRRINLKPVVIE